jgi:hypothetical protein
MLSVIPMVCALMLLPLAPAAVAQEEGDDEEELEPPPEVETEPGKDPESEPAQGKQAPPPPVVPGNVILDGPGPRPSPPQAARPRPMFAHPFSKPSNKYDPHVGFQGMFFISGHPTDNYIGMSFAAQFHVAQKWSFSLDGRVGSGLDGDDDNFIHSLGTFGVSGYHWFRGDQEDRRLQPYVRLGYGFFWLGDEHFSDGSDDDDDDDDWDKSSRNFKKNGVSGIRLVLFPRLWYLAMGGTLDLELALVQDNHYGLSDSSVKLSFGMTFYF